jgi:tRNA nucleotidyltransferase/poly(A) polymerase
MNIQFYKVGGAVRDQFLGVKSKDIDFAVEAPSFQAMHDFIAQEGKVYLVSPEYFTIRAKIRGLDADFVLCRKEHGYSDGRRPDSVSPGDIYDDLSRRDFTMNAIAMRMPTDDIIDPHNGVADIERRLVRCVGKAEDRFSEDSLRMIRAVRFAITKAFALDWDIRNALHDRFLLSKLENVSKERVREELNRCFKFDTLNTLRLFEQFPRLRDVIFSDDTLWLEATNKDR